MIYANNKNYILQHSLSYGTHFVEASIDRMRQSDAFVDKQTDTTILSLVISPKLRVAIFYIIFVAVL